MYLQKQFAIKSKLGWNGACCSGGMVFTNYIRKDAASLVRKIENNLNLYVQAREIFMTQKDKRRICVCQLLLLVS